MIRFEVVLADTDTLRRQAFRFRYGVYMGMPGEVQPYADHETCTLTEPMDRYALIYLALLDGEIIGTIRANRASDPEASYLRKVYRIDDFGFADLSRVQFTSKHVFAQRYWSSIYPSRLMVRYGELSFERGVEVDFIDVNKPLIGMFSRMGYFSYQGYIFHRHYGSVQPMFFALDTIDYLKSIGSILHRPASRTLTDNCYGGYELVRRHATSPFAHRPHKAYEVLMAPSP